MTMISCVVLCKCEWQPKKFMNLHSNGHDSNFYSSFFFGKHKANENSIRKYNELECTRKMDAQVENEWYMPPKWDEKNNRKTLSSSMMYIFFFSHRNRLPVCALRLWSFGVEMHNGNAVRTELSILFVSRFFFQTFSFCHRMNNAVACNEFDSHSSYGQVISYYLLFTSIIK